MDEGLVNLDQLVANLILLVLVLLVVPFLLSQAKQAYKAVGENWLGSANNLITTMI